MSTLRVLLVDDDASLLQTLTDQLHAALKVHVYSASSVPAAIAALDEKGPFDLLISDYDLPPHTARDLVQHLQEAKSQTPFLIHSGLTDLDESVFKGPSYLGLVAKSGPRSLTQTVLDRFPHAKKV